jgi:peptidyl-prolyl cis-trans isomerase SurA
VGANSRVRASSTLVRACAAFLFVAGVIAWAATASADRRVIDRIVAVVDDEAIFESDVEQAVRQTLIQQGKTDIPADERDKLFDEALQVLIDDKLVIAQAAVLGIDVPFSEVEAEVNKALDENRKTLGGDDAFNAQLAAEGLTMDELKKMYRVQIKNRMLVERVLRRDMERKRIEPTDAELKALFDERKSELPQRPAVSRLQTIFMGFDSSPSASNVSRTKIEALRARIIAGEDFGEVAKKESEDPSAALGGDLGFLRPQDLREPAFANAVASLKVGEVSQPVLTVYGYHLIQITEERPSTGEVHVRHILIRSQPTDTDIDDVFKTATFVYDELKRGVPFDSLAAQYNTDPAAGKYGNLGWVRVSELPQFFQDVLKDMKPGDVSQVLRESAGFRIVKLLEVEAERPYEFAEVRDEVKRLYEQERFSSSYESYLAELRKKFHVEIRS